MDPERWRQITDIFHHVLQQDPRHRSALLDRACAADTVLREQLERLLDAHDRAPQVVGTAAFEHTLQQLTDEAEPSALGRSFGPYKVVAELGRGGMGAVYLAERADDQYEKRVAIKLVKRGMDTEAVLAQFRQERQILASLEHAHIARLLLVSYYNEGEILAKMGRTREALDNYLKDLAVGQQLAAADPDNELYRGDLAYAHIRIGDMRAALGDTGRALDSYRRSRALRATDVKTDAANLWKRTSLIDADAKIAKTLAATGRASGALEVVKTTRELMEQTTVEPTNASIRSAFADAYADLGQAQVLIADSRGAPRAAKRDHWRAARALYGQSRAILDDLRDRGILTVLDRPKLDAVERQIARCERLLNPANHAAWP